MCLHTNFNAGRLSVDPNVPTAGSTHNWLDIFFVFLLLFMQYFHVTLYMQLSKATRALNKHYNSFSGQSYFSSSARLHPLPAI